MFFKRYTSLKVLTAILLCFLPLHATETADTQTPDNKPATEGETVNDPLKGALDKAAEASKPQKCDLYLIRSLGFKGHEFAKDMKIDMCPDMEKSCCTRGDQLLIYKYWISDGEENQIANRFEKQRDVYFKLIEKLIEVHDRSQTIFSLVENDKVRRNCKILSQKLIKYDIKSVGPDLKDKFKNMHAFFETTYKGFYCSICDANNDKFLKTAGNQFVFDKQFCRDTIYNSLHPLLYIHIYFMKYLNLASQFLSGCDAQGNFKETIIPGIYRFATNPKTRKILKNCTLNVNEKGSWFSGCRKICEKFKFGEFSEFFEPNLDKFMKFNVFIQDNLTRLKNEANKKATPKEETKEGEAKKEDGGAKKADTVKVEQKVRVLTEKKPVEGESKEKEAEATPKDAVAEDIGEVDISKEIDESLKDQFGFRATFKTVIDSNINLQAFASRYKDEGMNPYETGKNTVIDESQLKTIQDEVLKEEMEDGITEDAGEVVAGTEGNEPPRLLLGVSLTQIGVIVSLLLTVMSK